MLVALFCLSIRFAIGQIMVDYSWLILTQRLSQAEFAPDWRGEVQKHWDALRSQIIENDELWAFECSVNRCHELSGASGVCVKRGDAIIGHVVTGGIFE